MGYKILGSFNCPYCLQAKGLLLSKGIKAEWEDHGTPEKKAALKAAGFQTIPVIYKDGVHIGGYTELAELEKQGAL